jgi:HSP20 family molecular chaperone IbpA
VTAQYASGILTIKVAVKGEHQEAVKRIPVTAGKK